VKAADPSLQAIVFDFDGVLADTEGLHLLAFQQALQPEGVPLEAQEYYDRYMGFDDRGVLAALTVNRGLPWSDRDCTRLLDAKAACFRTIIETRPVVFDGVAERIAEWAGQVPFAIASGALREEIELILETAGLRAFFPVIVAAGETTRFKPAPDPYLAALERLGVDAARSVAVEDSSWGIESAAGAGMKVVAVCSSCPRERLAAADDVVDAFADLSLARLEALARR